MSYLEHHPSEFHSPYADAWSFEMELAVPAVAGEWALALNNSGVNEVGSDPFRMRADSCGGSDRLVRLSFPCLDGFSCTRDDSLEGVALRSFEAVRRIRLEPSLRQSRLLSAFDQAWQYHLWKHRPFREGFSPEWQDVTEELSELLGWPVDTATVRRP